MKPCLMTFLSALVMIAWQRAMVQSDPIPPHRSMIRSLAFSPDGKSLLVTSSLFGASNYYHSNIGMMEVSTGQWMRPDFYVGMPAKISTAIFSPDGKEVVAADDDSNFRVWSLATKKSTRGFKTDSKKIHGLSLSGDGKLLLSVESNGLILWNFEEGTQLRKLTDRKFTSAALNFKGDLAISDNDERSGLIVWETKTGKPVQTLIAPNGVVKDPQFQMREQVAFAKDEDRVLLREARVWIWSIKTGALIKEITPASSFDSCCFALTDQFVLTVRMGGPPRLWEVSTGKNVLTLDKISAAYPLVAVSRDGSVAATSSDRGITLWNLHKGSIRWSKQWD